MRLFGLSTLAIKALNVNSHSGIYDLDGNCKYQKSSGRELEDDQTAWSSNVNGQTGFQ